MHLTSVRSSSNYKWWAFLAIAVGTFTSVMDHGTVIVALPTIADEFDADLPTLQWVVVGYLLTISALLLPMGQLSDIIGRKQVYMAGFVVFGAGACLAGLSPTVTLLILSRVLMGVGAAMTQGPGMAMVASVFPGSERGKALGLHMSVVGAGAVAGPAFGGLLVDTLGWSWVFYISVPASILSIAAGLVVLKGAGARVAQDGHRPRMDWLGGVLSAAMLVALLLALTMGPRMGWTSPTVIAAGVGFAALLPSFVWWELRTPAPMLDLSLFNRRLFSLSVSAGFVSFMGSSGVVFLLMPIYLQSVLGFSASRMGLILVPNFLAMIVMGPLAGRLSDRYGWRRFNIGGLSISAAGLFLLFTISPDSPLAVVMAGMILVNSGVGIFNSPNNSSLLAAVEQHRYGVASAMAQLVRNSATVTSIAVGTAIVTAIMASKGFPPSLEAVSDATDVGVFGAFTSGIRVVAIAMGSIMLVGIVLSYLKGGRPREAPAAQVAEPQVDRGPAEQL